jgi:maltooligosyltrehalose trehalohydrolase
MWLDEFHIDGLRLDAVHAIYDFGARHILRDLQAVADDVAARTGRHRHVIAESDLNDPRLLHPPERGGCGLTGQWSDDFHHAVHTVLTGEWRGYYIDYGRRRHLAEVMERPFLYAGQFSPYRDRPHGAPPDGLSGDRFVVCLQNHDQVGNRARGDRLSTLLQTPAELRLAACLMLLSPHLPLLFMGEEYGETNPFQFFCSFSDGPLAEAVRAGRRREFAHLVDDGDAVPDPQAETTFAAAKLSWSWPEGTPRAGLRRLYRDLLTARREWPALRDVDRREACLKPDPDAGPVLELVRGGVLRASFNLSGQPQPLPDAGGQLLFSSEAATYGGRGHGGELAPFECVVFGPPEWRARP